MFTTPTLHREFFHAQTPNVGVILDPGSAKGPGSNNLSPWL